MRTTCGAPCAVSDSAHVLKARVRPSGDHAGIRFVSPSAASARALPETTSLTTMSAGRPGAMPNLKRT
jgi:hypothetical protein